MIHQSPTHRRLALEGTHGWIQPPFRRMARNDRDSSLQDVSRELPRQGKEKPAGVVIGRDTEEVVREHPGPTPRREGDALCNPYSLDCYIDRTVSYAYHNEVFSFHLRREGGSEFMRESEREGEE